MQLRVLCILGLILAVPSKPAKAALADDIIQLLEDFRVRMCHPFPKRGIPALDPLQITHEDIYIDDNIFKDFSASVTNLTAVGLSDFIINQVKISTLTQRFTFDLTFPLTSAETKYTAQGSLAYILNMVGDDTAIGRIDEVRVIITGGLKIGLNFGIKNLKIQLEIKELFLDLGELMEHDRLNTFVHNLINDLAIELFGDFWNDYGDTLTARIENMINKRMSGYSLRDIIAIISGSGEPIFGDDPPGDCKAGDEGKVVKPSVILQ